MHDIGTLGGTFSLGWGINASAEVTGQSLLADNLTTHASLYSGGVMHDLGTLGGTFSLGDGINAIGQVTGEATTSSGAAHAFLYTNSAMVDLTTEVASATAPYALFPWAKQSTTRHRSP